MNFEYYRPATLTEAVRLFWQLEGQAKRPIYYAGGTEILTLGRLNLVQTGAVIDVKAIPETRALGYTPQGWVSGAALTLTQLADDRTFPLLSQTAREVADRTARNKITLGGNICGQIFYREAVLPFLLADSEAVVAGQYGLKRRVIHDLFHQRLRLAKGELLVSLTTDRAYLDLPYLSIKKRQQWDTGYPLLTVAALKKDRRIRVAVSGLCPFPFRSAAMEEALNQTGLSPEARVDRAVRHLPSPVLDDAEGSAAYRIFVLRNTLLDVLMEMGGEAS